MKVEITFPTHRQVLKFLSTCTYVKPSRTDDAIPRFYDIVVWAPSRNVFVSFDDDISVLKELLDLCKVRYSQIGIVKEDAIHI